MASNKEILAAIEKSRDINDDQHDRIFKSAATTEKLAEDIQSVRTAWDGFKKVVAGVKNVIMYVGILYLIFKETIHKMLGVE